MGKTNLELLLEITALAYTFNKVSKGKSLSQGINISLTSGAINIIHYIEDSSSEDGCKKLGLLGTCLQCFGDDFEGDISQENLQKAVDYLNKKISSIQF